MVVPGTDDDQVEGSKMATTSVAAYILNIHRKRDVEMLQLSRFFNGRDFFDAVLDYIDANRGSVNKCESVERALQFEDPVVDRTSRTIRGVLKTGQYGFESDIHDVESGDREFERKKNHAELMPFYYLVYVPQKLCDGFVLLQRFRGYGPKTVFSATLKEWFQNEYDELVLFLTQCVPEEVAKEMLRKGRVMGAKLVFKNLHEDRWDFLKYFGPKTSYGQIEIRIRARKNGELPVRDEVLTGFDMSKEMLRQVIGIADVDQIQLEMERQGIAPKKVSVMNGIDFRAVYDISGKVKLADDGRPVMDDVEAAIGELLDGLRKAHMGKVDENA